MFSKKILAIGAMSSALLLTSCNSVSYKRVKWSDENQSEVLILKKDGENPYKAINVNATAKGAEYTYQLDDFYIGEEKIKPLKFLKNADVGGYYYEAVDTFKIGKTKRSCMTEIVLGFDVNASIEGKDLFYKNNKINY